MGQKKFVIPLGTLGDMLGVVLVVYLPLLINNIVQYKFCKENVGMYLDVAHINETGNKFF